MQRIGVKRDARDGDQAGRAEQREQCQYSFAPIPHQFVPAHAIRQRQLATLVAWLEQPQQGGQQGQRAQQGEAHADAGNQAQLRDADKSRRCKRQEAAGNGGSCYADLGARDRAGPAQRNSQDGQLLAHVT